MSILPAASSTPPPRNDPKNALKTSPKVKIVSQVSDDPSLKEEMESEVQKTYSEGSGSTLSTASGWASWAVGAIGAKFYKSSMPPPPSSDQSQQNRASSSSPQPPPQPQPSSQQKRPPQEKEQGRREQRQQREESKLTEPSETLSNAATDGWDDADDDDWGSLEESEQSMA